MQSFRISQNAPQDWEFPTMLRAPSRECASVILNLSANQQSTIKISSKCELTYMSKRFEVDFIRSIIGLETKRMPNDEVVLSLNDRAYPAAAKLCAFRTDKQ